MSEPDSNVVIIGIDPGQTTGFALVPVDHPRNHELAQLSQGLVLDLVVATIDRVCDHGGRPVLAIERFVNGPRSAKLSRGVGAEIARSLIGALTRLDVPAFLHPAASVKPWATDARLDRLGVGRRGMPHAADAFRVALYTGARSFGMADPLGRGSRPSGRVDHRPGDGSVAMLSGPAGGAPQQPTDGP